MHKKGSGESLLFFVFILIMIIVGSGIAFGVSLFFGQGYDFRQADANALTGELVECLQQDNVIINESFDFVRACGFSPDAFDSRLVYLKRISDGKEFFKGFVSYREECFFDAADKNVNLPKCVSGKILVNGEEFEFIVGSAENSRRLIA